jgi:hypothetical protein
VPVFRTCCSCELAWATVEANGAPFMSDVSMSLRMKYLPVSAVGQFLAFSGAIWLSAAAAAKPDRNLLAVYGPLVSCEL